MADLPADLLVPLQQGPADARCPACAATLRAGAPWCTLCYADLRTPEPAPVPAQVPPQSAVRPLDPLTAPPEALGLPPRTDTRPDPATWPCGSCGTDNGLEAAVCTACGAGFLASLRAGEPPLLELPWIGDLSRLSRTQRLGLAAGLVLAVVLVMALLGLLLG